MKSRLRTFLVLLLMLLTALQAAAAAKSSKPNFIVILSDDQSWVGTSQRMIPGNPETASDYFRTPNIERLAAQGMVFSSGYSPAPFAARRGGVCRLRRRRRGTSIKPTARAGRPFTVSS